MDAVEEPENQPPLASRPRRARRWLGVLVAALLVLLLIGWLSRERIAGGVVDRQLAAYDLPATYKVEKISPSRQVLTDVVIGDPRRPDMTARRIEVETMTGFGLPRLGRITLVEPRLYGEWREGKISFGALDKLLFRQSKEPAGLPDIDLSIVDGRARIESAGGIAGVKLEGAGNLRSGFSGLLAGIARSFVAGDCRLENGSLFGKLTTRGGTLGFDGPVRVNALRCPDRGVQLAASGAQAKVTLDPQFDGAAGRLVLAGGAASYGANRVAALDGPVDFTWRKGMVTSAYELAARGVVTPQARAGLLTLKGALRQNGEGLAAEGALTGSGIAAGAGLNASLDRLAVSGKGTLIEPLARQFATALRREGARSDLSAHYVARHGAEGWSLTMPQATLRGTSGETLLALSRAHLFAKPGTAPRMAGFFVTGGPGLPRASGQIDRAGDGSTLARLKLEEYRARTARIAASHLTVVQNRAGGIGLAGELALSGDLPGGRAEGLVLPVNGNWASGVGLSLWRNCVPVRFDKLAIANLTLDRKAVTLCPQPGGAIVRQDGRGLRLAAGTGPLDLAGRLGQTPIRLSSGALGFAYPGALAVRSVDVALGPAANASRFRVNNLKATIGKSIAGTFDGSDVRLAAVPLDIVQARGKWDYTAGRLSIGGADFTLLDRQPEAERRFEPLVSHDGKLTLFANRIDAAATLREPKSQRVVTLVDIDHNLATSNGQARLAVPGIQFDQAVQPDTLTRLALGVIANTRGLVSGNGVIDWRGGHVTSSGLFRTDDLDFAAAFGPVKGAVGEIRFTDLLGLVTAPDQRFTIRSVNPGIEVNDGVMSFELLPNRRLAINGIVWPYLDGKLTLLPTTMNIGVAEERRYTLKIEGLDAAKFVNRLELANINATGIFDGELPLVFDHNGGRIVGGHLTARQPGGSVSYVGALTYKDMGAMANFAFQALKSIDYKTMQIDMDGDLAGEIVTRVRFEGLSQGAGAKQNFLTRKIAALPIQFRLNVRGPFLQLITSMRSLYDERYLRDPRELGLIGPDGRPLVIQPPVSEKKP